MSDISQEAKDAITSLLQESLDANRQGVTRAKQAKAKAQQEEQAADAAIAKYEERIANALAVAKSYGIALT